MNIEISVHLDSVIPEMCQYEVIQVKTVYFKGVVIPINVEIPTPDVQISVSNNLR